MAEQEPSTGAKKAGFRARQLGPSLSDAADFPKRFKHIDLDTKRVKLQLPELPYSLEF